jgi:O-methyltransferase
MSSHPSKHEYKGVQIYQTPEEIRTLQDLVKETEGVEGHIAEIGVFKGGSARAIRAVTKKNLHLFDTFTGFPDLLDESDSKSYFVGDCAAHELFTKDFQDHDEDVYIYPGIFPETAGPIRDKKFSLVHIDVDIYKSTKDSLEFFKNRMSPGGVILVHDYPAHPGVKKAVDELGITGEVLGGRQLKIQL